MLRLVFTDLDDTFVGPDKVIPAENLRALDLAWERGVEVVPCTGRNAGMLPAELAEHPCVRYAVFGGGAIVSDVRSGESLFVDTIEKDVVRALFDDLRELDTTFDLFADGAIFTAADRWGALDRAALPEATRAMCKRGRTCFDGTTDELIDAVGQICRVNVFFVGEECGRRVYEIAEKHPEFCHVSSQPCNLEFTRAGVDKGSGVRRLCELLGVDAADVVAFGDSGNDVSMLEAAGDGVAVANATPEALAAADHVSPGTGAEGGVGRYLEPLLLELPVVRG